MPIRAFRLLQALWFKPWLAPSMPVHIQVELTTHCNLNCRPCPRINYLDGHAPVHLKPEAFARIIEEVRPWKITLSGVGEPLLHPDLLELIRLSKACGATVNTATNGTLLTAEQCAGLAASGLDLLKISFDAATPETYRVMRGQDWFGQVCDGIRTLQDLKKQRQTNHPAIRLNYVVTHQNYAEMAEAVELAQTLGVTTIYFQPLDWFGFEENSPDLVGGLTAAALEQEIRRALQVSRHARMHTNLHTLLRQMPDYWRLYQRQPQQPSNICLLPWFSAYITAHGDLRPCCTCLTDATSLGNVLAAPFAQVWNGARYQRLRQTFRQGKRPFPVCETCVPKSLTSLLRYATLLPGFVIEVQELHSCRKSEALALLNCHTLNKE